MSADVHDPARVLARGPWTVDQVQIELREDHFQPSDAASAAADAVLDRLRDRGSPAWDGLSSNLVSFSASPDKLKLELQPIRWSLRLLDQDGAGSSLSALCVVRDGDGRWLVGRRAQWVASWPGRWALGAAGAVEAGENPVDTLTRELGEEWSVGAEGLTVEALLQAGQSMVMLVGQCRLPADAEIVGDAEHDRFEWWPPEVDNWPEEIDPSMRQIGRMLSSS